MEPVFTEYQIQQFIQSNGECTAPPAFPPAEEAAIRAMIREEIRRAFDGIDPDELP